VCYQPNEEDLQALQSIEEFEFALDFNCPLIDGPRNTLSHFTTPGALLSALKNLPWK